MDAAQETVADYEQTIGKFRKLVEELQEQNRDMAKQLQSESKTTDQAPPPEKFDFRMRIEETKAHAKVQSIVQLPIIIL